MRVVHTQPFSRDTSPDVQALLVQRWRGMSAAEKARQVELLTRDALRLALAGIRERHPDASPQQMRFLLAERCLGRDLAGRALGCGSTEP
jgi:hypothetical protein